jgi:hypothetical protein
VPVIDEEDPCARAAFVVLFGDGGNTSYFPSSKAVSRSHPGTTNIASRRATQKNGARYPDESQNLIDLCTIACMTQFCV